MVEPINLNRARKARAEAEGKVQAAGNRVRFGRTKTERDTAAAIDDLARRRLDALRRDPGGD